MLAYFGAGCTQRSVTRASTHSVLFKALFILFYTLLYSFVLFYTVLYRFTLFYTLSYSFILFYAVYVLTTMDSLLYIDEDSSMENEDSSFEKR